MKDGSELTVTLILPGGRRETLECVSEVTIEMLGGGLTIRNDWRESLIVVMRHDADGHLMCDGAVNSMEIDEQSGVARVERRSDKMGDGTTVIRDKTGKVTCDTRGFLARLADLFPG